MPTATSPYRFDSANAGDDVPALPLNIAILYDDQTAYRRAMRVLADMLCERVSEPDVKPLPWRFEELRFAPWRERTLADAMEADFFVVATAGRRPVAAHVIEWLEEAFERRHQAAPTVTVVYDPDDDLHYFGSLCETLVRHQAESAGLTFLAQDHLAPVGVR